MVKINLFKNIFLVFCFVEKTSSSHIKKKLSLNQVLHIGKCNLCHFMGF